jgi:hypothetical protein
MASSDGPAGVGDDVEVEAILLRAHAHPLRSRIVAIAIEEGEVCSSKLAPRLGATVPQVAYHVRCLVAFGILRVVRQVPSRGALRTDYRIADDFAEPLALAARG